MKPDDLEKHIKESGAIVDTIGTLIDSSIT